MLDFLPGPYCRKFARSPRFVTSSNLGIGINGKSVIGYGRTLARVYCDGVDANAEQVRLGMAWVFERYASKNSSLYGVQAQAKAAKRGLWADTAPVPPWQWRRDKTSVPLQ